MGRKSVKTGAGKEKRLQRKQEILAIAAAQKVVNAANSQQDPLEKLVAFKKFNKNGLSAVLECKRAEELDKDVVDWAFKLLKDNMVSFYESCSWGWNDRVKKEEMTDSRAWYLIARSDDGSPIAFSHFRFDLDYGVEVLYCYEIQLESSVRRKGLGKFMVQVLELMGFMVNMRKVVLTVLKHNPEAVSFFKALNYTLDDTSPEGDFDEYPYEILSKPNKMLLQKDPDCGSGCKQSLCGSGCKHSHCGCGCNHSH